MNIDLLNRVSEQVNQCRAKYGSYAGRHEFLGVLIEEIEELKQEIFKKELDFEKFESELIDVITVLVKGYEDIVECKNAR